MPAHRLISLAEAVRRYTRDGMQYASGAALPIGSDAIVFGRELLRQRPSKLHAIFHCNSQTALEDYSNLAMALRLLGGALSAFGQSLQEATSDAGRTTLRRVCHVDVVAPA